MPASDYEIGVFIGRICLPPCLRCGHWLRDHAVGYRSNVGPQPRMDIDCSRCDRKLDEGAGGMPRAYLTTDGTSELFGYSVFCKGLPSDIATMQVRCVSSVHNPTD